MLIVIPSRTLIIIYGFSINSNEIISLPLLLPVLFFDLCSRQPALLLSFDQLINHLTAQLKPIYIDIDTARAASSSNCAIRNCALEF